MGSVLADTNILLRPVEPSGPEHPVVIAAIQNLSAKGTTFVIAAQVLFEFWVVATRLVTANGFGWEPSVVATAVGQLRQRFSILSEGSDLFGRWLNLVEANRVRGKAAHDARLAVVAISNGVDQIRTLNVSDFARFQGVKAVHPSAVS